MAQRVPAVLVGPGVGPSQLDQAVVEAVQISPEQMLEVLVHHGGIGAASLLLLGFRGGVLSSASVGGRTGCQVTGMCAHDRTGRRYTDRGAPRRRCAGSVLGLIGVGVSFRLGREAIQA